MGPIISPVGSIALGGPIMDGRQTNPKTLGRGPYETLPGGQVLSHGFRMMGSHEHETLLIEGHYRCPHCRRADIRELSDTALARQ